MDNKVKFKTRLAAVQVVFQSLVNQKKILNIKKEFDLFYRNQIIEQDAEKIQYNVHFLTKLINFYISTCSSNDFNNKVNKFINFDRVFSKWDLINQSIIMMAVSELINTNSKKIKIVINEYIEISKLFVNSKDVKIINAILDKIINEDVDEN